MNEVLPETSHLSNIRQSGASAISTVIRFHPESYSLESLEILEQPLRPPFSVRKAQIETGIIQVDVDTPPDDEVRQAPWRSVRALSSIH